MKEFALITPARRILGELFPLRKGGGGHGLRLMELARETPEEEIARDRRTLAKIAIGGGVLAGAGLGIIRKGRVPSPAAVPAKVVKRVDPNQIARVNPKMVKRRAKALVKKGVITPGEAQNLEAGNRGQESGVRGLEEKRDRLSQVRDAAIIGGTGAVGAGALIGAKKISDTAAKANATLSKVADITQRTAKLTSARVTPEAIAHEGGKLVKRKVKDTAKRVFPTFVKAGKVLTKHFETPAQRLLEGHEFAEALKTKDGSRYASRLKVAAGVQNAYREGSNVPVDLPIADGQVIKSAYRQAGQISKWGTRGGRIVKDAADVVTGKPRARDGSGRKKKREWEKSWAQEAGKKALVTGAVLGYATGMKRSPKFRNANLRLVKKAKDTVNSYVPNTFETPAQRLLGFSFQFSGKRKKEDNGLAIKAAAGGAAAGAANGAVLGTLSASNTKDADDFFAVRKKRALAGVADGEKPFRQGMLTHGERWARAEHNATKKLRKTMRRRAAGGGLAGAALLGGAGYIATRVAEDRKKDFSTPASRLIDFEDGKRFKKVVKNPETGRTKTVRYGQAGRASDGGDRIRPGTSKGDAYCARSAKIKGDWKSDPNSPNNLSREKWKCSGSVSRKNFSTPAQRILFRQGSGGQVGVISFDAIASEAGWDVRDPRGRSARVFAPGSRRRVRREKKWHEEIDNERKLWKGAVIGAGVLAGTAGVLAGRKLKGAKSLPKRPKRDVLQALPFPKKKTG